MLKIKFLYFAKVKELIQNSSQEIEINHKSDLITHEVSEYGKIKIKVRELFEMVKKENKQIENDLDKIFKSCLLSLNDDYIDSDLNSEIEIEQGNVISIIPPISAG
jgi:molybdopterin converting factor small subunit